MANPNRRFSLLSVSSSTRRSRLGFRRETGWWCLVWMLLWPAASPLMAGEEELGSAQLQIAGTQLVISPANQTVPFDTPTIVETTLDGYDPNLGTLPSAMRVLGDLTGPEISGTLTLEATPGEPFRIPRLRVEGTYRLENIRLMLDDQLLAFAEPQEAQILVTQILISRVSSRAMTLDEIRSHGLVIDENSFDAINLTFAYGVAGKTFDFNMPLIYDLYGPDVDLVANPDNVRLPKFFEKHQTVKSRFKVPKVIPFMVELERPEPVEIPKGGCDPKEECRPDLKVIQPMVGVILFPTEIGLLHQFFSVVLQVENGAPEGDPAILRDLFATVKLPPGLRIGETEPPTLLGRPVPIKDPGPDGVRGTSDDKNFLVAQASGDVELLLEGVKHGTHIVEFDINGVIDGLPTGPQAVSGKAKGAVAVRDPRLSAHIAHPQVVRSDIEYSVYITLSNIGNTPVNLVNLKLPTHALSGVVMVGPNEQTIDELLPGDSETVEFRVESRRTGKVVSSSLRMGSSIDPSFEYSIAVGDDGSLSPDSLVLPTTSDVLPSELSRQALALLGIGYSLAEAPPSLGSGLPRVSEEVVAERTYRLGQVGRHLDYGEPVIDVVSTLIADWLGVRDGDWDWDQLRRERGNGGKLAVAVADLIDQETTSPLEAFRRFASTTHYLAPQAVLATGGLQLQVLSRTSGKVVSGAGDAEDRLRDLPFAELYDLTGGDLVVLGQEEDAGFTARVSAGTAASGDLVLLVRDRTVPEVDGGMREVRFSGLSLPAGAQARVHFHSRDQTFSLEFDGNGDGIYESVRSPFLDTIAPRPFQVLAAVQNINVDHGGHVVDVLFSEELDLAGLVPRSAERFVLPDNKSNGGLVPTEEDLVMGILSGFETIENPFEGLNNPRIVKVVFDNPVSPFLDNLMTVSDLINTAGEVLSSQDVLVETRVEGTAVQVEGFIYGPDGLPLPGATVVLYERDRSGAGNNYQCLEHPTAQTTSDAQGRYRFGYVRSGPCGNRFRVYAQDPSNGHYGNLRDYVRDNGTTMTRDLVMPGRGKVIGRVTYEDGSVPDELNVVIHNPERKAGRRAHVDENGFFDAEHVIVGTLTLATDDGNGNFAYATFELPSRGETVERNVVILRNDPMVEPPGGVRGTVKTPDGQPVFDAYVALYVSGDLSGVERTDPEGAFDFGQVPSGIAEIEVFTEQSTLPGLDAAAQVFFEVEPDQTESIDIIVREDRGEIRGHVYRLALDGSTTPVEGAVVWVDNAQHHTVTDENGFYSLLDVFAGSWRIQAAVPETGEQIGEPVTITTAGGVVDRDLYFEPTLPQGGIIGKVLGYDGEPVSGARIHLSGGYLSTIWTYSEVTDNDGRFIIEGLDPGTYGVHAISGFDGAIGWAKVRFPGDTEQMTVRFEKGTIRGRTIAPVGEDGTYDGVVSQIAFRKVEVVTKWDLVVVPPDFTYMETDANGYFEIEGLLGPYELHVFNAFHGRAGAHGQLDYHGQVVEHEFKFKANGDIRGVVYDHDGETPVAGARVRLEGGSFADYDVYTDENGEYHFPLVPPDFYQVHAFHSEGVIFRRARVAAPVKYAGEQVNEVDLTLPIQGALTGWVQDADGYPVAGAVVTMQESRYPWRKVVQNADEEGNYAFENVFGGGPVTLYAVAPTLGGLKGRTKAEVFFEAQDVLTVITLEAAGEVAGTVYLPAEGGQGLGDAVPLASVELSRQGFFEDASTTDSEGQFYFDKLPLGWYQAIVYDQGTGRRGRSEWVELQANNDLAIADVELESRGVVRGRFIDGDTGNPLPGHTVQLRTVRWFRTYATTDIEGYFEFGGIPEGDFALYARGTNKRRFTRAEGVIQYEDQEVIVDLALDPLSEVTGRVHNPPGAPDGLADNVNIRIEQNGRGVVGAGFDNPFSFGGIIPRLPFTIIAKENGGLRKAKISSRINTPGEDKDFDLTLQALGSVEIHVTDSFGSPINGAEVHVSNKHDFDYETFDASTGADHSVTFADIREGQVSVIAWNPINGLRGAASGDLNLDGQLLRLNVELQDTGFIRGRAVLSDGITPAVAATVAVQRGGKWLLGETDEVGSFFFDAVPLGSYKLVIQENDGLGVVELFASLDSNGEEDDWGTLVLDDTDPFVVSIDPATGTRDLPLSTQVHITFSEPMDPSRQGGSVQLRKISGTSVGFSSAWSADDTVLTLTPSSLASGTGYDVFIGQNMYDRAGRNLEWRVRSNFFTADVIPPAVIRTLPRPGDVQVPVDSNILITFSEPVDEESLSGTAIQVTDLTSGQGLTTTFQLRPGDRELIVTPAVALIPDHDIQVTVQNVADLAGNVMPAPVSWSFWTPDFTPPTGAFTTPDAGTVFTAGDTLNPAVDATDNRGMKNVEFSIGDWSATDSSSPYSATLWAPVVAQTENVDITAVLTDRFGNATTLTRAIQVEPHVNGSAPTVEADCWFDGDWIQAGVEIPLKVRIEDDERIESYALIVNGVVDQRVTPVNEATADKTFYWRPPHDTPPGTTFEVKVQARDYAGNLGEFVANMWVPSGQVRTSDQVINELVNGQDLILGEGTFTIDKALDLNSLRMMRFSKVITRLNGVDFTVTGDMHLQCGAQITVNAKGYEGDVGGGIGGAPDWVEAAARDAGGSHGGAGQANKITGSTPDVYDSVYRPTMMGGGGPHHSGGSAGNGGGTLRFDVGGQLRVDGLLTARGATGGGAGGTIAIDAAGLSGVGLIDASGADAHFTTGHGWGGPGGGGRIALYVDDLSAFDWETQALARGGWKQYTIYSHPQGEKWAAPGTLFVRTVGSTYGEVLIDNGLHEDGRPRNATVAAELPTLGTGNVTGASAGGADLWVTAGEVFRPRWLGAWMTLLDGSGSELGTFEVVEINESGDARLAGASAATAASTYRGVYRFDRFRVNHARLEINDPLDIDTVELSGNTGVPEDLKIRNLILRADSTLYPESGDTLIVDIIDTLTLETGATMSVAGRGYDSGNVGQSGQAPPWVSASSTDAGGSHGGHGRGQKTTGGEGEVYDSVYYPQLSGGGGAAHRHDNGAHGGGDGGGIIVVRAREVVLDGTLTAQGERGTHGYGIEGGAGAGGSIHITADVLRGAGLINAAAGDTPWSSFGGESGTAGGGRVALYIDDLSQFDVLAQTTVRQGYNTNGNGDRAPYSAPGTLYVSSTGSTYGDLYIPAGEVNGSDLGATSTELPALASGTVSATDVAAADLWITSGDGPFRPRWHGAWMQLVDGTDGDLGTFRVSELDESGRARLEGAAAVTGAVTYQGEYRFDNIHLLNGAGLAHADSVVAEQVVLAGNNRLEGPLYATDLTVKAGAVLKPTSGDRLDFVVSGTMTVEAGAVLDVTGLGYPAGPVSGVAGAPEWVSGSTSDAGGSHGGHGQGQKTLGGEGDVFDSVYQPRLPGGGGAAYRSGGGGDGGGIITIQAGTLVLDGTLKARGERGTHGYGVEGGAGAGGTIQVTADVLSGAGFIDASAGDTPWSGFAGMSGTGGGGRVALFVDDVSQFDVVTQITARNGINTNGNGNDAPYSAPGTIYVESAGSTYGDLFINAGTFEGSDNPSIPTELPTLGNGSIISTEVAGADLWITGETVFRDRWLGTWMALINSASQELGAFRVLEIDGTGRARLDGAGSVAGTSGYRGEYRFDNVRLLKGAGLRAADPIIGPAMVLEGNAEVTGTVSATDVTVKAGATVKPASGGRLDFVVSGTMTVEAGAVIDVTGRGYEAALVGATAGAPEWVSGSTSDAGGSHGGHGQGQKTLGGEGDVYDSVYHPILPGGGGAAYQPGGGGDGGGVITIQAGTLVLDGTLKARGERGTHGYRAEGGSGAGGTVHVTAGSLSGAGFIDASAGDTTWSGFAGQSGTGGGGRVALHVDDISQFDIQTQVSIRNGINLNGNGNQSPYSAPGTVYVASSTSTYGDLYIDALTFEGNHNPSIPTVLPTLGAGTVTATEAAGSNLWITSADIFRPRWHGVWMAVDDGAGAELGVFRVIELDESGRALLEGAAAITGVGGYRGEYRFDRLSLRHGAGLIATDKVLGGAMTFHGATEFDGDVRPTSVTVEQDSSVKPLSGHELKWQLTGPLVVETGGEISVVGRGYLGGASGQPAESAPGVDVASGSAGGSHGGFGGPSTYGGGGTSGEIYDSVYTPHLPGAGGGEYEGRGMNGGGVIWIEAPSVQLDGKLNARGEYLSGRRGTAAGGTIRIHAPVMTGTGEIDVSGRGYRGSGCCSWYPFSGGGRVALYVDDLTGYDLSGVRTIGSNPGETTPRGAPGTLYTFDAGATYGDLIIDGETTAAVPFTRLPAIGVNRVAMVTDQGADAWIEPMNLDTRFSVGVAGIWVRIDGVDYKVLEERADRRGLLLEGAAGALQVGQRFWGVYRFDSVTVDGGARLELDDAHEVAEWTVGSFSTVVYQDTDVPGVTLDAPVDGALYAIGETISIQATVSDASALESVTLRFNGEELVDSAAPYEWQVFAPVVEQAETLTVEVVAVDVENNDASASIQIGVEPVPSGNPPTVGVLCPSTGAMAGPGTSLQVSAEADDDHEVFKVEFWLDGVRIIEDFEAPYATTAIIPATAQHGDVLSLEARAYDRSGQATSDFVDIRVLGETVITSNLTIADGDTTYDGLSMVVAAGATVTFQGAHSLTDLAILDGARVRHPLTVGTDVKPLELDLTGDLYIGCNGSVDANGLGYDGLSPRGQSPFGTAEGNTQGGSHGGRGGGFDGSGRIYGNPFDPRDAGAGGGSHSNATYGGGVVRLAVLGNAVVDGKIQVRGGEHSNLNHGAGGSIRLDAAQLSGLGSMDASGSGSGSNKAGGGGGRIALYLGTLQDGFLDRIRVTGGNSSVASQRGSAGTLFVRTDGQAFGDLYIDNKEIVSSQVTELPSIGAGTVTAVDTVDDGQGGTVAVGITDELADFTSDLRGLELLLNGDTSALWTVFGHEHHGQSLTLNVAGQPLTAQVGETYSGLLRLDRLVVDGQAKVFSRDAITTQTAPEVAAGSTLQESYTPTVSLTEPLDAALFTSGDPITVTAVVDDPLGFAELSLSFGAETVVDSSDPYTNTWIAPVVSQPTDYPVRVELTDFAGRVLSHDLTITVQPLPDPFVPEVTLDACPANLDYVLAGSALSLTFAATDNEAIERYSLWVDGVMVSEVSGLNTSEISASVPWTVPVDAAVDTTYTLEIRAYDFSGGHGSAQVQLRTPGAGLAALSGSQTLDATVWNGQRLVLGGGSFEVLGDFQPASLTLAEGGVLTTPYEVPLKLTVAGDLDIQCGGSIGLQSRGYAGGDNSDYSGHVPAGIARPKRYAGGSHGGLGRDDRTSGHRGEIYDSVYLPSEMGGGGARGDTSQTGGRGGGLLVLDAQNIRLEGSIRVDGQDRSNSYAGTGAGGTALILADSLTGSGVIDASGGHDVRVNGRYAGLGGGGRVALYVDDLSAFSLEEQVLTHGGIRTETSGAQNVDAAPGTLFVKDATAVYGDLVIDGESDRTKNPTRLPALGVGNVTATEAAGADLWITGDATFQTRWLGAWVRLFNAADTDLGRFEVSDIGTDGRLLLVGAAAHDGLVTTYSGEYVFDSIALRGGARLNATDPIHGVDLDFTEDTSIPPRVSAGQMTIREDVVVRLLTGYGYQELDLRVTGALTLETGSSLTTYQNGWTGGDNSDYNGDVPPGVARPNRYAGGSHGGVGRADYGSRVPGEVYDSVYRPQHAGGGGARGDTSQTGGKGGGILRIQAGSVMLDGNLASNGENRHFSTYAGTGGGGTVSVHAGSISGSGLILASGGDNQRVNGRYAGLGGGGRVELVVNTLDGFDPVSQIDVAGGIRTETNGSQNVDAAVGTAFVQHGLSTYGDLIVNGHNSRTKPVTLLPVLGGGSVSAADVSGSDLWITDLSGFKIRWLGSWVRLFDSLGADLGLYNVAQVDESSGRLLLTGAGALTDVADYAGEYRFDRVVLEGGARLDSEDLLHGGNLDFTADTEVSGAIHADEMTVRSGVTVSLLNHYTTLELKVAGGLEIESGGLLSAYADGYDGGNNSDYNGHVPDGIARSPRYAGGSHGGIGRADYGSKVPSEVYDSVYRPRFAGGGGGRGDTSQTGGAGGGIVRIEAGSVQIDGAIDAGGAHRNYSTYSGTGAGGTVIVQAGELSGTGQIGASGGDNQRVDGRYAGLGGGGRVGLYVDTLTGFDPITQVDVTGGIRTETSGAQNHAAAGGTVYVKTAGSTYGDLILNGPSIPTTSITELPELGSHAVTLAEADGADLWLTAAAPLPVRWDGVYARLTDALGADLGRFEVTELDELGRVRLEGAGVHQSEVTDFAGEYVFDELVLRGGARLEASDPIHGGAMDFTETTQVPGMLSADNMTVRSGAVVGLRDTHSVMDLQISGILNVEAGGELSASNDGYDGGDNSDYNGHVPTGITPARRYAGGSHGGVGKSGRTAGNQGEVYGSVYMPHQSGGGGARGDTSQNGGAGGGVLQIAADQVIVDGVISSNGRAITWSSYGGTGAGGTILIDAQSLSGTGEIQATGGDNQRVDGRYAGLGGGGRIALYVDDLTAYDLNNVHVEGGVRIETNGQMRRNAAVGTLYVADSGSTYGDLILHGHTDGQESDTQLLTTQLPILASGLVTATEAIAGSTDVWIAGEAALQPRWLGAWVTLEDAGGGIGTYPVVDVDALGRLRLLGAGSDALTATGYLGEYRFDSISVTSGAVLDYTGITTPFPTSSAPTPVAH